MPRLLLLVALLSASLAALPACAAAHPPQTTQHSYPLPLTVVRAQILGHLRKKELKLLERAWLPGIEQQVKANWRPLQPEVARPPMTQTGATVVVADVTPTGKLERMNIQQTSDDVALDQAAEGAVRSSIPFPPLPPGMKPRDVRVQLEFLYN